MTATEEWFVLSYKSYVKPCKKVKELDACELAHKAFSAFTLEDLPHNTQTHIHKPKQECKLLSAR